MTSTLTDIETIKRRAARILNQAANAANEHEKNVFQAKAFAMMAQYGLSEAEMRMMSADQGKVVHKTIPITGPNKVEQTRLWHSICRSLHCASTGVTGYTRVSVYGVESHVQRAIILFELLKPQMLAEARQATPPEATDEGWNEPDDWYYHRGRKAAITREFRRNFLIGFAAAIEEKLFSAEKDVIDSVEAKSSGADLVLMADFEKAQKELARIHPKLKTPKYKGVGNGFYEGVDAGRRCDLGNKRIQNKKAIG